MASTHSGGAWEYLFVGLHDRNGDLVVTSVWGAEEDVRFNGGYAHEALQTLGQEDWELVTTHKADERSTWYVFKRPA